MDNSINNIVYKITVDTTNGKVSVESLTKGVDNLTQGFVKAETATKSLGTALTTASASAGTLVNKTGLASAATVELGRTVSDLNYGFTAIANNISQLGTLMTTLIGTTGGVKAAVGEMWKALAGPLGVLFAFQIVVAVIERFSINQKKAKESIDDTDVSLQKQVQSLREYNDALENVNTTEAERLRILRAISAINKELETANKLFADDPLKLKEISDAYETMSKAKLKAKEVDEQYARFYKNEGDINKVRQKEIDLILEIEKVKEKIKIEDDVDLELKYIVTLNNKNEELKKVQKTLKDYGTVIDNTATAQSNLTLATEDFNKSISKVGSVDSLEKILSWQKQMQGAHSANNKEFKAWQKNIDETQAKIDAITGAKGKGGKSDKDDREIDDFKAKQLDLSNIREKYDKKDKELLAKSEWEKLAIEKEFAMMSIDEAVNKFRNKESADLEDFMKSKATNEQKKKAQLDYNKSIENAIEESRKTILGINKYYDDLDIENLNKAIDKKSDAIAKGIIKMLEADKERAELIAKARDEFNEFMTDKYQEIFNSSIDFANGEFDRTITIEQNKTNALNNELRKRLDNENLSKEERSRIQDEIAANDEKLRVKQESLERKRFELNKAASIANAVVNTYLAAATALKNFGGVPTGLPAMYATIAVGLLQVATIARQKFQSSASSASGGSSVGSGGNSGGDTREISFNIVGKSKENQLANAIGAKFSEPLRAYVVSKEITSQQQFDLTVIQGSKVTG